MTMVLSLVDQLHGARALLRAMTEAVHRQPDHVREAILTHVRVVVTPRE
jgi:chaperone modulatory protein CbpM